MWPVRCQSESVRARHETRGLNMLLGMVIFGLAIGLSLGMLGALVLREVLVTDDEDDTETVTSSASQDVPSPR